MRSFPFVGGLGGRRTAAGIGPVYIPLAAKAGRDVRWLVPVSVITMAGVIAGVGVEGLPAGAAGVSMVGLVVAAAAGSRAALSGRIHDLRVVVPALAGLGLSRR